MPRGMLISTLAVKTATAGPVAAAAEPVALSRDGPRNERVERGRRRPRGTTASATQREERARHRVDGPVGVVPAVRVGEDVEQAVADAEVGEARAGPRPTRAGPTGRAARGRGRLAGQGHGDEQADGGQHCGHPGGERGQGHPPVALAGPPLGGRLVERRPADQADGRSDQLGGPAHRRRSVPRWHVRPAAGGGPVG